MELLCRSAIQVFQTLRAFDRRWQCSGRFVGNPMGIVRSFSGISGGFRRLRIEWPKLCETFGNQSLDFIQLGIKRPRFRVIECFKLGQF